MSESKKSELDLRDKAVMHQQRRLKQATQFTHKDSADLLPLDGLKRLGTSKDLQPHSIIQRRLLAGNITQLHGEARDSPASRARSPLADSKEGGEAEERSESTADSSAEERESPEESERSLRSDEEEEDEEEDSGEAGGKAATEKKRGSDKTEGEKEGRAETERQSALTALLVQCKCCDAEVKVSINTGCLHNHISSSCCRRLGLKATLEDPPGEQPVGHSLPLSGTVGSTVRGLQLQLGRERVQCSAQVMEEATFELCLGLQTLLELKCCVDLSTRVLRLQGSGDELPFLETPSQCRHDNNKNL